MAVERTLAFINADTAEDEEKTEQIIQFIQDNGFTIISQERKTVSHKGALPLLRVSY